MNLELFTEETQDPELEQMSEFLPGCSVDVLRADRIHPIISGNKVWKLHFNLKFAIEHGYKCVASFGGVFSNHLHALAYCCQRLGLESMAFLRSHNLDMQNPTLQDLHRFGMRLHALPVKEYALRYDQGFLESLVQDAKGCFLIPEGGHNELGVAGVTHHLKNIIKGYDFVCTAVGSGTTVSGILSAAEENQKVLGISVVNLREASHGLRKLGQADDRLSMQWDYHWGGYGRCQPALVNFCNELFNSYGLPLEPIYTGKLFYAVKSLYLKDFFPANSRILLIHSGGLQGARGLQKYRKLELEWMAHEQDKTGLD